VKFYNTNRTVNTNGFVRRNALFKEMEFHPLFPLDGLHGLAA